tara:strand:- start:1831 stop:2226 length:396 start_codon:yes stop_codon:yes gene_type:complete
MQNKILAFLLIIVILFMLFCNDSIKEGLSDNAISTMVYAGLEQPNAVTHTTVKNAIDSLHASRQNFVDNATELKDILQGKPQQGEKILQTLEKEKEKVVNTVEKVVNTVEKDAKTAGTAISAAKTAIAGIL